MDKYHKLRCGECGSPFTAIRIRNTCGPKECKQKCIHNWAWLTKEFHLIACAICTLIQNGEILVGGQARIHN